MGVPSRRIPVVALGILAVVAVGVAAFVLGQRANQQTLPTPTTSTSGAPRPVPADFVTYADPEAGFSLKHPKTWRRVPNEDLQVPEPPNVVLTPGGLDYVSVRVTDLEGQVGPDNIGDLKAVTDAIIVDAEVRVLQERSVTVNGMAGYYYLYTFNDAASSQEGLHAHYFLFRGNKMYAIVFQAVPADAIRRLEPTFDAIRDSFVSTEAAG